MGLLDLIQPPAPILTSAQKQARYKAATKSGARSFLDSAIAKFNSDMGSFWANPDGLTPQECAAALGTDAAEAVTKLEALKTFCNQMKAGSITRETPKPITFNNDGTITVGE